MIVLPNYKMLRLVEGDIQNMQWVQSLQKNSSNAFKCELFFLQQIHFTPNNFAMVPLM